MATSPKYNSGVFVRFPDPGDDPNVAREQGYEVQIMQIGPSAYPVGEWNSYEIRVIGQIYTVILNGATVVDSVDGANRGREFEGYIGLQNDHQGSRVRFRNIRLREL
jgi:hypothetical protein